jgi:hypothetical protein
MSMMCQCGCDIKVDCAHLKRVISEFTSALNHAVEAGDFSEIAKAIKVRNSVLSLLELLDFAEEFKSQD